MSKHFLHTNCPDNAGHAFCSRTIFYDQIYMQKPCSGNWHYCYTLFPRPSLICLWHLWSGRSMVPLDVVYAQKLISWVHSGFSKKLTIIPHPSLCLCFSVDLVLQNFTNYKNTVTCLLAQQKLSWNIRIKIMKICRYINTWMQILIYLNCESVTKLV